MIAKAGVVDAIDQKWGGDKGDQNAVAETIENNVRAKVVKEHLNDPTFYDKISRLLEEIIRARREKALSYEAYLKRIGALIANLVQGKDDAAPPRLDTPGKRALYNNLSGNEELALKVDAAVKVHMPDDWRGVEPKERTIKQAMYDVLKDQDEVERLFKIIKAQKEY